MNTVTSKITPHVLPINPDLVWDYEALSGLDFGFNGKLKFLPLPSQVKC